MGKNEEITFPPNKLTKEIFSYLEVRLIKHSETKIWNTLMKKFHYLGFRSLVGESLKYIAIFNGEWVALLGWGAAAFKVKSRDRWIGWSHEDQWSRLKFIANNQRFLILPRFKINNLASKVLSMNLKRLSHDWQMVHGHPIVLAETFVDHERFTGACYCASNWLKLGQTRGFGRNCGKYFHHGKPKTIYVYPLRRDAQALLSSTFLSSKLKGGNKEMIDLNAISIDGEGGLLDYLKNLTDPRKRRGIRHNFLSVLAVAICAKLAGNLSYTALAQWAKDLSQSLLECFGCRFDDRKKKHIPPSEPTIRRVLQSIDADELDSITGRWFEQQCNGKGIAVDGKTCRGSGSKERKPVHLVSALSHDEKKVVSQKAVDEKSNEIKAFIPLLEPLELKDKVITADAMHTQRAHAEFLVGEKGADYVFGVKENQKTLLNDIKSLDTNDFSTKLKKNF